MGGLRCRVLVVGCGPAGASAAYHLTRFGEKDVIVIEKFSEDAYRRYHSICGEAVSDRMLRRSGIDTSHIVRRIDSIEISAGGDTARIRARGSVVDRAGMLREILSRSEAKVIRAALRSVSRIPEGGFEAETTAGKIVCDILIGADGAHSTVRKCLFGTRPEMMLPIVNTLVPGDSDGTLRFFLEAGHGGCYSWDFPSAAGMKSVGFRKGLGTVPDGSEHGARCIPAGRVPRAAEKGCILAGDAAGLPNPLSYGGIGAALVSGKKAAEAACSGNWQRYDSWIDRELMFDRRFMDAHKRFSAWTENEMKEAIGPLSGNATVFKGLTAMIRHPKYARVYMACWLGFKVGW